MKWLSLLIAFVGGVFVGDILGIPYLDLAKPVFKLLPYQWWIVIALTVVILFLLSLMDGSRRYHERVVAEINANQKKERISWQQHAEQVWRLSIAFGMAQQAFDTIDFFRQAMSEDGLKYLDANINNTLYQCFEGLGRDTYYKNMPPFPAEAEQQTDWIRSHCVKLEKIIEQERWKQLTVHTATTQKQLI